MIRATDLTKRFGPFVAVDGLSFEIGRGEIVGLLGPNGAGKTTTLRMLTGYLPATSGGVTIAGLDVLRDSLEVRRHIGYLPESVPLYGEMRVGEMLDFQGRLHRLDRQKRLERAGVVLERVGLSDRRAQRIDHLSKGLRQRVGLAVALLPDPDVLILDEPTSGLDPLQRMEVRDLIRELAADRTVLVSSHILPEIEAVCPRVLILHRGRLAADGRPADLVRELGGEGYLSVEAAVGPDVSLALRLIESLPGVSQVREAGRLGLHQGFEVRGVGDLREDVGALAQQRGWALRELSWQRPTLEAVFASIALDLSDGSTPPRPATGSPAEPEPTSGGGDAEAGGLLVLQVDSEPKEAAPPASDPGRMIYSLNPFDRGATRDLSQPVQADAPPPGAGEPGTDAPHDSDGDDPDDGNAHGDGKPDGEGKQEGEER